MDAKTVRQQLDDFLGAKLPSAVQQRRREILRVATELFVDQGYQRASVGEIARRAGITKPTLYSHFESKAHLLLHALALEKRAYLDRLEPAFDESSSAKERLRSLVEISLSLGHLMPLTGRLLAGEREVLFALETLTTAAEARAELVRTSFHEALVGEIAPRASRARRREIATVLVSLTFCSNIFADEHVRQGIPHGRFVAALAKLVVDGVGA